tara:strand:- start:21 stop:779 length:759 start_codon:yes stop_codon:yes gene_type:complete
MNRKIWGQHKLIDNTVLDQIVEIAQITKKHIVYEIGSGTGNLTYKLCTKAKKVISSEIDEKYYSICVDKLSKIDNLELIRGDGFKIDINYDILMSNLPYSKSSQFVEWLINENFIRAVVLVQTEFADKLVAKPGNKNYRSITVITNANFYVNKVGNISNHLFSPIPKVLTSILLIKPKNKKINIDSIKIIKFLFSMRGKKLSSIIKIINKNFVNDFSSVIPDQLSNINIEKIEIHDFLKIVDNLSNIGFKIE